MTTAQLNKLPDDEQLDHFAYDHHRQQGIMDIIDSLQTEREKPSPEELKEKTNLPSFKIIF